MNHFYNQINYFLCIFYYSSKMREKAILEQRLFYLRLFKKQAGISTETNAFGKINEYIKKSRVDSTTSKCIIQHLSTLYLISRDENRGRQLPQVWSIWKCCSTVYMLRWIEVQISKKMAIKVIFKTKWNKDTISKLNTKDIKRNILS